MQADLAHSFSEMKLKMRGGEEVEYEMVACVNRGKVKWDGLRVAGLCIGIDEYTNLDPLHNAVRDTEAVNGALIRNQLQTESTRVATVHVIPELDHCSVVDDRQHLQHEVRVAGA